MVKRVKCINSNNHCIKVTENINIRKIIFYEKRHIKLLKINSSENVLAYCKKLIGVSTKEKNLFEGEKTSKIIQNK